MRPLSYPPRTKAQNSIHNPIPAVSHLNPPPHHPHRVVTSSLNQFRYSHIAFQFAKNFALRQSQVARGCVSVLFPQSLPPWAGFCRSDSRSGFPRSTCSLQISPSSLVLGPFCGFAFSEEKIDLPSVRIAYTCITTSPVVLRDTSSFRPNTGLLLSLSLFLLVSICLYSTIQNYFPIQV